MNSREIKAELILKDVTFRQIADEVGCSVAQVSMCINGNGLYLRVRKVIAKKLGKKIHEVFQSNHPTPKRPPKKRKTRRVAAV